MSIFSKLFSKSPSTSAKQQTTQAPKSVVQSADPANDPNLIRVFDKYGQELFITKEEWRKNVLPGAIQSHWDQPDELYGVIVNALNDGFSRDVIDAAAQLYKTDPMHQRGACLYAIVLMENSRLDDAERVLRSYLESHGDNGVVLTNLAKIHATRKQMQLAEETLWHALEVDPNQDNGLAWYQSLQHEAGGEEARVKALQRIAALPGSWRAQIWLARTALDAGNLEQAVDLYRQSLWNVGHTVPADLLMQMSGDLGNRGHLNDLLALTEPHFKVDTHGLQVGNNLIKAHLQLGHFEEAQNLVNQLYAFQRPDWRETLGFWETEIARERISASQPTEEQSLDFQMLTIDGPVWLDSFSPAKRLFQVAEGGPLISFIGGSAEMPTTADRAELQMPDAAGRLSRALPLNLAERIGFACQVTARTLLPWLNNSGFVLSGGAWTNENVAQFRQQLGDKSDLVVVVHLRPEAGKWHVELRLVQSDGQLMTTLESVFASTNMAAGISDLARRLTLFLVEELKIKKQVSTPLYQLPGDDRFGDYLLREEQLLAVRCARIETAPKGFLHGAREIIEGNLQLCLACPQNVVTRVLLAQTLVTMNKVRPDVVKEFAAKIEWLQSDHPLDATTQEVIKEMLEGITA